MVLLEIIPQKKFYLIFLNFLLGLSLALSFEPFNIPFFSVLIIGFYFVVNEKVFKNFQSYYKIFFYNGVSFGFGFFLLSMYWVSNSISAFDPTLFYLVPLIIIIFPLSLSIFFGVMQLVNAFLWCEGNSKLFYFSSTWAIFEFLRSFLFTGLPWNLLGYSWSWSLSFSQSVSFLGIHGLGLLSVFCSVCMFSFIIDNKNKFYFIIAITILLLLYGYGTFRINNNQTIFTDNQIRIVHTYFDQENKWKKSSIDQTILMGSSDLITVFPETSLGTDAKQPKNWIFGYIRKDRHNFFNSINYMGFTYDKKILVPFGEYFPFFKYLNILFTENHLFNRGLTKGDSDQLFAKNILPLICYEAIFSSFVRNSVLESTNLLVNISNDAWFGNFSGPIQHFVHAKFRAIELGIPMVRSSNKGFTGLISPLGDTINIINSNKNGFLDVKIPKKLESTFYLKHGNILTYFLIVLFFIIGYAINSKKNKIYE